MTRWAREYGDIFHYRAGWIHVYFLNRPDLIEFVLVRNHSKLLKDRVQNSRWFFGDGLLTSEGEEWKRQRRLAQPAYYRERVASYAGIMTDYTEQMLSGWRDGAIIDVHQEMMNLTLRIVVRTLFGVEAEDTDKISGALNTMMRQTAGVRLLLPPVARRLPLPGMAKVRRAVRQLNDVVSGITRREGKESWLSCRAILVARRPKTTDDLFDSKASPRTESFLPLRALGGEDHAEDRRCVRKHQR
jgi:cytochrome P450